MSRFRLKLGVVATLTPLLMLTSPTNAHAIIQQSNAFTILGQQISSTAWGCGVGVYLDTFAGWNTSTPTAQSPMDFVLVLCHAGFPSMVLPIVSVPVYGYYISPTFGTDRVAGHVNWLGFEIVGNTCTVHYALDFSGQFYISTTTPESVGTTVGRWPSGAIRLDIAGTHGDWIGTACSTTNAPVGIGGQVQVTGPS